MATWIHPAHGRAHLPTRHQRTVTAIHRVARASTPVVFDPTPQERLLLAIFGLRDGETPMQALADLRHVRKAG